MLYMIRLLKWPGYHDCQMNSKGDTLLDSRMLDNSSECNQQNSIQQLLSKLFLFRTQPLLNPFSITTATNIPSNPNPIPPTFITLPHYQPPFTYNFLHNSSNSYPTLLTRSAIPSLETNQNYLTLTLNSLVNILLQIIVLQLVTSVGIWLCKITTYETQQKEEIKVEVEFASIRHQSAIIQNQPTIVQPKQQSTIITDPKIQWLSLPKPHQCITVKPIPPKNQKQHQPNPDQQIINKKISQHFANQESITLKLHILFVLTTIKSKRVIFYTSWILMQLTSQTYLVYFELVKPFSVGLQNTALQSLDGIFSSLVLLALLLLPALLLSLQPLYLHKLAAITYKNPMNHSYSLQQLFLDFCIVYYEGLVIAYSVALGKDLFWQSLPIAVYQTIKMVWIWPRMKVIEKLKSLIMLLLFTTIALIHFIPSNYSLTNSIAQHSITTCIYLVLLIELIKILKFFIVTLINLIKTKIQPQPPLQQSTQTTTINQKHLQVISLTQEQPQTHQKPANYLQKLPFSEYPSQKTLLPRKTKEKHLETIKQKSHLLKQLKEMRQSLKNDLQQMKLNNRKDKRQKNQNHETQKQSHL